MAKQLRPTGVASRFACESTCSVTAVEDIAPARPSTTAVVLSTSPSMAAPASAAAQRPSCNAPRPNTSPRMTSSRSSDSSSPIMNSSSTTPSRAIGAIAAGSLMVTAVSAGTSRVACPRPNGPTTTPTSMKPSTVLTRMR